MPHPDKRFHPTEKPIPLLIELLEDFTKPGETIFDPFAGSASLGLACLMTGRKYLGIEINKDFHTRAMKRLQRASTGLSREKYKNAKQIGLFANG
jgi:site-specific DNA-methyltransferase (adenine-specific)